MKITFDVDPRTASALLKYAACWSMTPGEIIDGLMRFYKREMKERYNHEYENHSKLFVSGAGLGAVLYHGPGSRISQSTCRR